MKNGLILCEILKPELKSETGFSESSQAIWEIIAQWEQESRNSKLIMVKAQESEKFEYTKPLLEYLRNI